MTSHRLPPRVARTAPAPAPSPAPSRLRGGRKSSGSGRVVPLVAAGVLVAVGVGGGLVAWGAWKGAKRAATVAAARDAMNGRNDPKSRQKLITTGTNAVGLKEVGPDGWAVIDDGWYFKGELPGMPDCVAGPIELNGAETELDRWNYLRGSDMFAVSIGIAAEKTGAPPSETLKALRDRFAEKGRVVSEQTLSEHGMEGLALDVEREGKRNLMRIYARPKFVAFVEFGGPGLSPDAPDVGRVLKSLSFYPPPEKREAAELAAYAPAETPTSAEAAAEKKWAEHRALHEEIRRKAEAEIAEKYRKEGKVSPWEKIDADRKAREEAELKASATPEAYQGPKWVPASGRKLPDARLEPGTVVQATKDGSGWYPATVVGDRGKDVVVRWNGSSRAPEAIRRDRVALPPEGFPQPVAVPE